MLWFRRPPEASRGVGAREIVAPASLEVKFDERTFGQKFAVLVEQLGQGGGVDPYLESLAGKSRLFQAALTEEALERLDVVELRTLLETVMPARKRLWPVLERAGIGVVMPAMRRLLYGSAELEERLTAFVAELPVDRATDVKAAKKLERAAHDFAAELLHFRDPERYPLMTRWVWDQTTHSGAMREFVKGGDTLSAVPLGTSPGVYEAGRVWVAEQLAGQGLYREPYFVVDLFLAHAYADYMRAMSSGMGLMNADFGGSADPLEPVKKLLGIDSARRRESRIRKAES